MKHLLSNRWVVILASLILFYIVFFSYLSLKRHWSLGTYYYDLGIMHQVVANSAKGYLLEMTYTDSLQQISRFAKHFDPLMLVFVPIYWFIPKAEVLLVGQTFFLALGAIPVYLLAKRIFQDVEKISIEMLGVFFAFLYLNYYPLQRTNLFDFHPVVLVTSLLLWALYFAEIKRYKWSFFFIVLSLLGKENVPLVTFMIGVFYLFIRHKRTFGLVVAITSIFTFILVVGVIIPANRPDLHFASSYFSTDIKVNLERLLSQGTFLYIFKLLQPLGFLSIFSPLYLLIALPEWLINILSKNVNMRDLQYHYTALLTPFIIISSMYGYKFIYQKLTTHIKTISTQRVAYLLCAFTLLCNLYTWGTYGKTFPQFFPINEKRLAVVKQWEERLADHDIPVSSSGHLAPYFSGRRYFYNFLFDFSYETFNLTEDDMKAAVTRYEAAEYVIIQRTEMVHPLPLVNFYYTHLKQNKKFQLIFNEEGIEVYKKI